jgi:transcriptional regulator with XRE-family HTH domain
MNISDLLERARANLGVSSDRALCRELDITSNSLLLYRRGIGFPNDETMLRICAAARVPAEEGLLMLNMWRSSGRATTIYARLLKKLRPGDDDPLEVKGKCRTVEEQILT